ncbi:hypothetical protein [Polycladidibacter hongkongensis]|uniref:hypothetical protein n=1 Tax=Polycladidibacter hongkongensis TaxID=1647556 RepID=UPI00082A1B29|nr:hypothetical protein [Pseudovibrio hongkongensis]
MKQDAYVELSEGADKFKLSEAEIQLLKYQMEEQDFARLLQTVAKLPPEMWQKATHELAALTNKA